MQIELYRKNRARFSPEELEPYDGWWAAFSVDGSRLVAAAEDLITLNRLVREAGENPQQVAFERIVLGDDWMGEIEFE